MHQNLHSGFFGEGRFSTRFSLAFFLRFGILLGDCDIDWRSCALDDARVRRGRGGLLSMLFLLLFAPVVASARGVDVSRGGSGEEFCVRPM
jgi:hypothetical protein